MPSLGSHLAGARVLADRIDHPAINSDRGSYYLGATTPDIRVITSMDRSLYHFFDLNELENQDSIARLFETHPSLSGSASLDPTTRAFMAGYLTHLVMDQDYIERIYRVYFAGSVWGDDPRGNLLDRVLQYEMDRREREDRVGMDEIGQALANTSGSADVAFVGRETLGRWLEIVRDIVSLSASWDRFPRVMERHLARAGYSEDEVTEFCSNVPEVLAETLDHVTESRIDEFLQATMDRSLDRMREYLS